MELLSPRVLNPYGEIGYGYPYMSMIVIGHLLPILRKNSVVCCMMFIDCLMVGVEYTG
jgi:hypothetical protein